MRNKEIKNEKNGIKKWKENIMQKYLKYKANKYTNDSQHFGRIRLFNGNIYNGITKLDETEIDRAIC